MSIFVLTCHIFECDAGLLFHVDLGLALPHAVVHGAHPLHEHTDHEEGQQQHTSVVQHQHDAGIVLHHDVVGVHAVCRQFLRQIQGIAAVGHPGVERLLLVGGLSGFLLGHVDDPIRSDLHLAEVVVLLCVPELREAGLGVLALADRVVDGPEAPPR